MKALARRLPAVFAVFALMLFSSSLASSTTEVVPDLALVTATIPESILTPPITSRCLVRNAVAGADVTQTMVCYSAFGSVDPPETDPPASLVPFYPTVLIGSVEDDVLTTEPLACTPIVHDLIALQVLFEVPLGKSGVTVDGDYSQLVVDTDDPFDCDETPISADLTMDPLDLTSDTDGDLCTDYKELGGNQTSGGLRDAFNPYDYNNPTHDGRNRVDDILKVVGQYFKDDTNGIPGEPPYTAGYNPDTDRTSLGPNPWNLGPPNGQQRIDDILAVVKQYFHDCP